MLLIFDLDGTLLNTIADLGTACNHALQALGYPTHPIEEYPRLVGNGVNKLIERALPAEAKTSCNETHDLIPSFGCGLETALPYAKTSCNETHDLIPSFGCGLETAPPYAKTSCNQTHDLIQRMRAEFIPFYNAHNLDLTRPYAGMPETLQALKAAGHRLAVASNKYQEATAKVVAHFFPDTFDVVFGERAGVERKPNPQIVYDIQQALYGNASDVPPTLYIGDSLVDIATARNASLPVAACTWGFVAPEELAAAHPDYLLHQPKELISICKCENPDRSGEVPKI